MKKPLVWTLVVGGLMLLIGISVGWFAPTDNDTTIPTIAGPDAQDLATRLAEAEAAHDICYGWELSNGRGYAPTSEVVSSGSSRGPGVDAENCPRWVELRAVVDYTSASSELEDYAAVSVATSSGLSRYIPSASDLDRVGVTREAVMNEPASATGLGALALPLLLAEQGAVEPLAPPSPATAAPATPIGHPGSDYLGNHGGLLITLSVFGGVALVCLVIGLIVLNRKRGEER